MGLAETNSTLMCSGCSATTRPQLVGSARTPATAAASARSDSRTLRKPGGATSTEAIGELGSVAVVVTWAAMALAISIGARRYGLASFMARLLEKSPKLGSDGRSIMMASGAAAGAAGSVAAPAGARSAWARCHAAAMASRTWDRRLVVASEVMCEW